MPVGHHRLMQNGQNGNAGWAAAVVDPMAVVRKTAYLFAQIVKVGFTRFRHIRQMMHDISQLLKIATRLCFAPVLDGEMTNSQQILLGLRDEVKRGHISRFHR